jgi:hypothetical protein
MQDEHERAEQQRRRNDGGARTRETHDRLHEASVPSRAQPLTAAKPSATFDQLTVFHHASM